MLFDGASDAAANCAQLTAELAEARQKFGGAYKRSLEMLNLLDAERFIHARTKGELTDARAQLAKVRHDRDEMIRVHDEVEQDRDLWRGRCAVLVTAEERDHYKARLGRAVAALRDARQGICEIYRHVDQDREIKAMKACKPICDAIDAILADAESEDAFDARRGAK
jgi:hypothetical protein